MDIGDLLQLPNRQAWHDWLEDHHASEPEVWLTLHTKAWTGPRLSYEEAVEEAIAFGWVDSQAKRIDASTYAQRFTPRRPGRPWAASNLERARRLYLEGRMTPAGLAVAPPDARWSWAAEAAAVGSK